MLLRDKLKDLTTVEIYELVLNRSISRFPEFFWEGEDGVKRGLECVEYLLYEKLKWDNEKIRTDFSKSLLIKNKLAGMLSACFGNSPLRCVLALLGDTYEPWEYNVAPKHYWSNVTAKKATATMINKLGWNEDDIKDKLSQKTFKEFGLSAMLIQVYGSSPYRAINDLMPGKFKEWEFNNVPLNFWSKENCEKAIIWVITKEIGPEYKCMNYGQIREVFIKNRLAYMLRNNFDNSIEKALDSVKDKINFNKN